MKVYRVALIGTGAVAGGHIRALEAAGTRVKVVAAVDIDEHRVKSFCEQHNIPKWYCDSDVMLETEQPDLVHINTPPSTHYNLILKCLMAGAWVYCEKPLCGSLQQFDHITQIETETGCYVSTVFQWRFGSAAKHLKNLIEQGTMGEPLVGVCNTFWYRDDSYYADDWHRTKTGIGGVTTEMGIHLMDLFLWLLGDWSEVTAKTAIKDRSIETDNVSMAIVRFEQGTMATIANSAISPRQESHMRIDFQQATVEVTTVYSYTNQHWRYSIADKATHTDTLAKWQDIKEDYSGSHAVQLNEILNSMDNNERPFVSGLESRRILEFISCLFKSAETGQTVLRGSLILDDPFYHSLYGLA